MRRAFLALLFLSAPAFAGQQLQCKSEEAIHIMRVFVPINIFAARRGKTIIDKVPVSKPMVKAKPKACPVLTGKQKCKRGRTQSPKHNCKCGRW